MLHKTSNESNQINNNFEIKFFNSKNLIIFILFNEDGNKFYININIDKKGNSINILDIKMFKEFDSPLFILYELAKFLKKKKFEYLTIKPNTLKISYFKKVNDFYDTPKNKIDFQKRQFMSFR